MLDVPILIAAITGFAHIKLPIRHIRYGLIFLSQSRHESRRSGERLENALLPVGTRPTKLGPK